MRSKSVTNSDVILLLNNVSQDFCQTIECAFIHQGDSDCPEDS